jgi:hypothetical protein
MPATYEPIATSAVNGVNTVTFSSIPQTYTDLKVIYRGILGSNGQVCMRWNGSLSANYNNTFFRGTAGSMTGGGSTNQTEMLSGQDGSAGSNNTALITWDILNYSNTIATTYKNAYVQIGQQGSSFNLQARNIGSFTFSTAAITSVTVFTDNLGSWSTGSRVTLYGIKRG